MMKEGIINLSISLRLYCTFATFPTRDPRGLPELCSRDPGHRYSQADTPCVALPRTRGGAGASLTVPSTEE